MYQEKSGYVTFSYNVIWSKQKTIWTKTQTTHLLFNLAVMHLTKHTPTPNKSKQLMIPKTLNGH